ncbi:hypothetical protein [Paenibacillus agri]|uniref:Uncharacterized protein n=1 Tax=Paenibacillus agri TaxID=2744309 RepID=A0A850ENZ9_9BACL|nr:hypothetical protein [Paenibacillus agri]NUU61490.1 hypothetical protein [Paenibacillus agri]
MQSGSSLNERPESFAAFFAISGQVNLIRQQLKWFTGASKVSRFGTASAVCG